MNEIFRNQPTEALKTDLYKNGVVIGVLMVEPIDARIAISVYTDAARTQLVPLIRQTVSD
jgi:hypothetical protein